MTEIIELTSRHGDLYNNRHNQLRRLVGGDYQTVFLGEDCGTVKSIDGAFDWWLNANGVVEVIPAR